MRFWFSNPPDEVQNQELEEEQEVFDALTKQEQEDQHIRLYWETSLFLHLSREEEKRELLKKVETGFRAYRRLKEITEGGENG